MRLELLAPAKNATIGREAILCGADAVYIGASSHGARKAASNSVENIGELCLFAHKYNARVYVTLNTLVYQNELPQVERLIGQLYRAGVDALIVQDLGLLRLDIPPIALHASTQCDIRDVPTALFLQSMGFSQLVLARELSLKEIAAIHEAVDIPLEAFIHGALCVSFSGCCRAGQHFMRRSGNRGECPQICRLPFSLTDRQGTKLVSDRHLLSLKDMNRIEYLREMAEAGVSSFKIEGRLKDADYVRNVVTAYREQLDNIIEQSGGRYQRASDGLSTYNFIPDLSKSFNRGYTDYFLKSKPGKGELANFSSPKMTGEKIGEVRASSPRRLTINLLPGVVLANGDGLGFFNSKEEFEGFRLNRVDGDILFPARPVVVEKGTAIFRNLDSEWERKMQGAAAARQIGVDMTLRGTSEALVLELTDPAGNHVAVVDSSVKLEPAKTDQTDYRRKTLARLGATIWQLAEYTDNIPGIFVPASRLTELRKKGIEALENCRSAVYRFEYRRPEDSRIASEAIKKMTVHNVANDKSLRLYKELGISSEKIVPALETEKKRTVDGLLMECRYCLRRELGACLKRSAADNLSEPLILDSGKGIRMRAEFDCSKCIMKLYACR